MRKEASKGITKAREQSLEVMSTFDYDENLTLPTTDVDLDDGSTINGLSGVLRSEHYCRAIHNWGATQIILHYEVFGETTIHSMRINSGGTNYLHNNIRKLLGSDRGSTTGATINLKWIDKQVVDGAGARKIA